MHYFAIKHWTKFESLFILIGDDRYLAVVLDIQVKHSRVPGFSSYLRVLGPLKRMQAYMSFALDKSLREKKFWPTRLLVG